MLRLLPLGLLELGMLQLGMRRPRRVLPARRARMLLRICKRPSKRRRR